jgi:hypothetical protein
MFGNRIPSIGIGLSNNTHYSGMSDCKFSQGEELKGTDNSKVLGGGDSENIVENVHQP